MMECSNDATAYDANPPGPSEFSSDENLLAWDSSGWEDIA